MEYNRQQKRNFVKYMSKRGKTREEALAMLVNMTNTTTIKYLAEGTKVKIKYEQVLSHFSDGGNPIFTDWLEKNKDNVFTIEYDERHTQNPQLVCLAEDESNPKNLFWDLDLYEYKGD